MQLLLLSNSTNFGEEYLHWCKEIIANFVGEAKERILFIPYAAVGFSTAVYTEKVNSALQSTGMEVQNIDDFNKPEKAIEKASAIFIGGGNTFNLLKTLQDKKLIEVLKHKIKHGVPYVGWSAGSNIAGKTIRTTNDMPIVEPKNFHGLELISQQINPHYTEATIPNHGGETRIERLQEFISANPNEEVVCLPEATYLHYSDKQLKYKGESKGYRLYNEGIDELLNGSLIK